MAQGATAGPAFSAGRALGRTFSTWAANLLPFSVVALVVYAPIVAYTAWVVRDDAALARGAETWAWVRTWGALACGLVASGAMAYGVVQHLAGRPASVGGNLRAGFSRILPVLGVSLMLFLYMVVAFLLAAIVVAIATGGSFSSDGVGALFEVAVLLAILLVTVPFWVAVPAAVAEPLGPMGALRRSRELTRGCRLRVLGVLLVLHLLVLGAPAALEAFLGTDVEDVEDLRAAGADVLGHLRLTMVLGLASEVLVATPLLAVASGVGYHDLRRAKEGTSTEELARVFE